MKKSELAERLKALPSDGDFFILSRELIDEVIEHIEGLEMTVESEFGDNLIADDLNKMIALGKMSNVWAKLKAL